MLRRLFNCKDSEEDCYKSESEHVVSDNDKVIVTRL